MKHTDTSSEQRECCKVKEQCTDSIGSKIWHNSSLVNPVKGNDECKTIFKKAVIDQMLLWIVLFVAFVTIFLLVIDYYMVLKTKDRADSIVNYGVRMKALGRDDVDIVIQDDVDYDPDVLIEDNSGLEEEFKID